MAVPRKLVAVPNAATRELWRIVESGDVDELEDVLPQADINARNEHGMTALMRAAHHGRPQMVRVLLEHGADPNVKRNDNFTALSLAAFFGHAEIVELLIRHGANTDVATRHGTSPHMWATARSFGDVAASIEKRRRESREPVVEKPAPPPPEYPLPSQPEVPQLPQLEPTLLAETETQPLVVRTLKDPPEIWDLVHEAPRNFNARSAFMARMGSKGSLKIAALLLVAIGVGGGAFFYMKDRMPASFAAPTQTAAAPPPKTTAPPAQATRQPVETPQRVDISQPVPNNTQLVGNNPSADISTATPNPPPATTAPVTTGVTSSFTPRSRSFAKPRAIPPDVVSQSDTVQKAPEPPVVVIPKPEVRASNDTEPKKTNPPANTQVITPPKTTQPKAKVIQWP